MLRGGIDDVSHGPARYVDIGAVSVSFESNHSSLATLIVHSFRQGFCQLPDTRRGRQQPLQLWRPPKSYFTSTALTAPPSRLAAENIVGRDRAVQPFKSELTHRFDLEKIGGGGEQALGDQNLPGLGL